MDHFHVYDSHDKDMGVGISEDDRLTCRLSYLKHSIFFSEVMDWIHHLIEFSLSDIDTQEVCDVLNSKIETIVLPFLNQLGERFVEDDMKSSMRRINEHPESFRFFLDCIMYDRILVKWNEGLFVNYKNEAFHVKGGGDEVGPRKQLTLAPLSILQKIKSRTETFRAYNSDASLIFKTLDSHFFAGSNTHQLKRAQLVLEYTQDVILEELKLKNSTPLTELARCEHVRYYLLNLGSEINWCRDDIKSELWKLWPDKYKIMMATIGSPNITIDNYSTWLESFSTYSYLFPLDATDHSAKHHSGMSILNRKLIVRDGRKTPKKSRKWVEQLWRLRVSAKFFEDCTSFKNVLTIYNDFLISSKQFRSFSNSWKQEYEILKTVTKVEKSCNDLKQSYNFFYNFVYVEIINFLYNIKIRYSLTDEGLRFFHNFLEKYNSFLELHRVLKNLISEFKSLPKEKISEHESGDDELHDGKFSEHESEDDELHDGEISEHESEDDELHDGEISEHESGDDQLHGMTEGMLYNKLHNEEKSMHESDHDELHDITEDMPDQKSKPKKRYMSDSLSSKMDSSPVMGPGDFEACKPWFDSVSPFLSRRDVWKRYFNYYNARNSCNFSVITGEYRQVFTEFKFCLGYNIVSAGSDQINASAVLLDEHVIPDITICMDYSQHRFRVHVIFWKCNLVFSIDSVSFFLTGSKGRTYDLNKQNVRSGTFFSDLTQDRDNSAMYFQNIINSHLRKNNLQICMQSRENLVSTKPNKVALYLLFQSLNTNTEKLKNRFCITLKPDFRYLTPWKSIQGLKKSGESIGKLYKLISSQPTTKELLHASYVSALPKKLKLITSLFDSDEQNEMVLKNFRAESENVKRMKLIMIIGKTLESNDIVRASLYSICPDIDDRNVLAHISPTSFKKSGKRAKSARY